MGDLRKRLRPIENGATTQSKPTYSLSVPVVRKKKYSQHISNSLLNKSEHTFTHRRSIADTEARRA